MASSESESRCHGDGIFNLQTAMPRVLWLAAIGGAIMAWLGPKAGPKARSCVPQYGVVVVASTAHRDSGRGVAAAFAATVLVASVGVEVAVVAAPAAACGTGRRRSLPWPLPPSR